MKLLEPVRVALEATCHKMVWDRGDWEDVLQKVLLTAWARFDTYEPTASFRSWVFSILFNTVYNENRGSVRRKEEAREPHDFNGFVALLESPEYAGLFSDSRLRGLSPSLEAALNELRSVERGILLLRIVGELKYSEIADAVGVPIGTVMSHLHRARLRLREALVVRLVRRAGQTGEGA